MVLWCGCKHTCVDPIGITSIQEQSECYAQSANTTVQRNEFAGL
jgi:hypothetical protein